MRKRAQARLNDYWLSHCGWCRREIGEDVPCIGIGMKFRDRRDYERHKGKVIEFGLVTGQIVLALVVTPDSPAKREGKDLLFMVCSDECGDALSSAMRKEWELADS
jgi:hypothetical protein